MSETAKYRHLVQHYCTGNGVDIGSGGDPVVPHAIQIELPDDQYERYNGSEPIRGRVQWRGTLFDLPFKDDVLDFCFASHVIEDFSRAQWISIFKEWKRALKVGGYLIALVPEVKRWHHAVYVLGQPPNCSHCAPEPSVGDMSAVAIGLGMKVVEERLTDCYENDYSILGVFKK